MKYLMESQFWVWSQESGVAMGYYSFYRKCRAIKMCHCHITDLIILFVSRVLSCLELMLIDISYNFDFLEFQMVACHFCKLTHAPQYLYTSCNHFLCLACCYQLTDFNLFHIQCCLRKTRIDPLAMTKIIKQNSIQRKYAEPMTFSPKKMCTSRNDIYICEKSQCSHSQKSQCSHSQKSQCSHSQKSHTNSYNPSPYKRSNVSQKKDSLWKELEESAFQQVQEDTGKKDNPYKFDSIKENLYTDGRTSRDSRINGSELESILLTQIERVKREFDEEHDKLRKKEEQVVRHLIRIYEEETKEMCLKSTFQNGPTKLHSKLKQCVGLEGTSEGDNHYDHIMKRLDVNKARMEEKIQKHRETLS